MKRYSNAWLLAVSITTAMLFFAACTSPNDAGIEVLPDDDIITGNYVDSFTVEMGTILVDSVNSANLSRCLFGNYVDEEFGWLFAETYIQPRITGSNLTFGDNIADLSLDSIVLTLDLTGFYGRFNDPVPLEIFEITEAFPDSNLASNVELNFDSLYDFANGYQVDFSGQAGFFDFLDIRLDDSLGRKLLFADPANLTSNADFTSFFKGLKIRSQPVSQSVSREPGGIFEFDPRSNVTEMRLYYKDNGEAKIYSFVISDNSERYHRIIRNDYTGRLIQQAIDDSGDPNGPYAAVEAGALVNLYVGIPSMSDLGPAIINRADLILNVDPDFFGSDNRHDPPSELFLFVSNEAKDAPESPDVINSSASYDAANNYYSIPMTNTLQQILAGRLSDNGFILIPGQNGVTLNRAVIGGPGHPSLAPELRVIYTTLPGKRSDLPNICGTKAVCTVVFSG